ncbi:MAG TPA: addiction module protein [Pyrinomonadaceae bacterium]|nr:addiction module protein [Pyrinomonadaceae bacterium]
MRSSVWSTRFFSDLDKPDPEIDRVWANEARRRWAAYKEGRIPTVSYEEVMPK